MIKNLLIIILFVYICSNQCYAQYPENTKDIIVLEEIDNYIRGLNSLLFEKEGIAIPVNHSQELDVDSIFNSSMGNFVYMQKSAFNARTGLSAQVAYNYQMGLNVIDLTDEDDIYPFRNKIQVVLKWDILESSLIGRKPIYKIFELEGLLNTFNFQKELQTISKEKRILTVEKKWNEIISFIFLQRVNLLTHILRLKEHLYNSKRVLYSDVSRIQIEILNIRALMVDQSAIDTTTQLIDLEKYQSNLILDTVGLFDIYLNNNIELKQYKIEQQLLNLNKRTNSYLMQMNIGVFVKAQYYGEVEGSEHNGNMNIGVSVTLPISLEYKRKRVAMDYQIALNKREQYYAQEGLIAIYNSKIENLTNINNKLIAEIAMLKPIKQNILNSREMYQNNVSSFEQLIFQYDAYLTVLSNTYQTIKQRDILIESLIN